MSHADEEVAEASETVVSHSTDRYESVGRDLSETAPETPTSSQSQKCLRDLLDEEYYLSMILACLIEDGLHECRRVCRKWRDVCSRLPVELADMPSQRLADAIRTFPNTISLPIIIEGSPENLESFCEKLVPFTGVKCLSLTLEYDLMRPVDELEVAMLQSLAICLPSLDQLESLSLYEFPAKLSQYLPMVVKALTNLRHLRIRGVPSASLDTELLSDVQRLESLHCHIDYVFDTDGTPVFPSLTNLTRLVICAESKFDMTTLEALRIYASTLKGLHITNYHHTLSSARDWLPLAKFFRLESFGIRYIYSRETSFWKALGRINPLTALDIGWVDLSFSGVPQALFGLTDLQSLTFDHIYAKGECHPASNLIGRLTKLTRLNTNIPSSAKSLGCLTGLVSLSIDLGGREKEALECFLVNLVLLEELDVTGDSGISSKPFSNLQRLKSVRVCTDHETIDQDFVHILAHLPCLTRFCFVAQFPIPPPLTFYTQFNLLSNLRELDAFQYGRRGHLLNPRNLFFEGSFPKLRSLRIGAGRFPEEVRCELMRRFPCLNRLT